MLRVAGVPEHFNLPWHLAQEKALFEKHGVRVEWHSAPLGTGFMVQGVRIFPSGQSYQLKDDKFDLVIALTEGLVADIAKGSDLRLLATYVESPLTWAISTGKTSAYNGIEDLRGQTFGVSRLTSGSHLMAIVLALQRGWNIHSDVKFAVKGDFQSLRNGVNDNSTAAFMWETFTTKPFHDNGELRRIGDITTPWPCFMVAARQATIDAKLKEISAALAALVSERYSLKAEDAKAWYSNVKITATRDLSEAALERAISVLTEAKVIPSADVPLKTFYDSRFVDLKIDIKAMKLYNKPELVIRLYNELRAGGLAKGKLSYRDLIPYDQQHHYHSTEALDSFINQCAVDAASSVISLGSGLGGPARYIAGTSKCQVLAVELQGDLNATAAELTTRCDLDSQVHHVCGDFLQIAQHLKADAYDSIASWLTVLHIMDRQKLFALSHGVLKPGKFFYAEDFYERKPFTAQEKKVLEDDVFCKYLPNLETYKKQLEEAGFVNVRTEDLTSDWTEYTKNRVATFESNKSTFVGIHGEDTYKRLLYFYSSVRDLYAGGNLGGVRIVAQKPAL